MIVNLYEVYISLGIVIGLIITGLLIFLFYR